MASILINGKRYESDAPADMPLLWVIRDLLGLSGTKFGCGRGLCGACTVLADGKAIRSCTTPIGTINGRAIVTVEGVGATAIGQRVQAAWREIDVPQCGYCQPGQIMSAVSLLFSNPKPSDADVDDAMSGNICRCGTYNRIRGAIHKAAGA